MIRKNLRGFTLIELLIVITIIGIILALSIFGLQGARESARDGKRKADLEQIRSGLELYKADCNKYPSGSLTAGNDLRGDGSSTTCSTNNYYLTSIPGDPNPGRLYPYTSSGTPPTSYTLCASLEGVGSAQSGCGSCGTGFTCNYKITNP